MTRLLIPTLLIAALTFTAPAAAQDGSEAVEKRTVEGAQKFLAEVYGRGGYEVSFSVPAGLASGELATIENVRPCETVFAMVNAKERIFADGQTVKALSAPGTRHLHKVHWGEASKVVVVSRTRYTSDWSSNYATGKFEIQVADRQAEKGFYLMHPSKEEADRVAFAIQFLREQCALKSETGF